MPLTQAEREIIEKTAKDRLAGLRAQEADNAKQQFIKNYKKQVMTGRAMATRDSYGKAEAEAWAKVAERNKQEADYKGYETFLSGMLAAFYTALKLGVALSESLKLTIVQLVDATLPILSSPPEYRPNPLLTKVITAVEVDADRKLSFKEMRRSDRAALTNDESQSLQEALKLWLDARGYSITDDGVITAQDGAPRPEMTPEQFINLRDHPVDGLALYLTAHFNESFELNRAGPRP